MAKPKLERIDNIELVLIDEPKGVVRLSINQDKVVDLAKSIEAIGLLQPILLRPENDRYEIVYGHRRYLAHKYLGKTTIRATVKKLSDIDCALMRGTENLDRENLTPIEEAAIYKDLNENANLTLPQISKRTGKSESLIKRRMDLLRMPPCLQQAIHAGQITYTGAEELWRLGDLPDIEYFLGFAVDHGATVSVIRQWVNDKLSERRRQGSDVDQGGGIVSPMESRPVYVPCDLCLEPMEIGKETVFRSCPVCTRQITNALKGGET